MPRKRYLGEQIISKLREAEVELAGGHTIAQACRKIGVSEQTFYRWRHDGESVSPRVGQDFDPWRNAAEVSGMAKWNSDSQSSQVR